jgi:hypothetical protein
MEYSQQFTCLAADLKQAAAIDDPGARGIHMGRLQHKAGNIIIAAHKDGALSLAGLDELIEFHTDTANPPTAPHPRNVPPTLARCAANLFGDVAEHVLKCRRRNELAPALNAARRPRERKTLGLAYHLAEHDDQADACIALADACAQKARQTTTAPHFTRPTSKAEIARALNEDKRTTVKRLGDAIVPINAQSCRLNLAIVKDAADRDILEKHFASHRARLVKKRKQTRT